MHERISSPSSSTEHAPHCAIPQPRRGPLNFRSLRSTNSKGVSGAAETTCFAPFTDKVRSLAISFSRASQISQVNPAFHLRSASRPSRRAVATRYHTGQLNAQLGIHGPLLLHVGIVNAVTPTARRIAELNLI